MYKASAGIALPTSIIGSLPRPNWYTAVLGSRSFLEAMVNAEERPKVSSIMAASPVPLEEGGKGGDQ